VTTSNDGQSSSTKQHETAVSSKGIYLTSVGVSIVVIALGFLSLDLYQRRNDGAPKTASAVGQAQKAKDVLPKLQPNATQKAQSKPVTQPLAKTPAQPKASQHVLAAKPAAPSAVAPEPVTPKSAPAKIETSKAETAKAKLPKPAKPKPIAPQTPKPRFDIVRVETDGTAVIAGRATPGADVEVMSGKTSIGKVKSNTRGEWAVVLEKPLKPGAHDLSIVSSNPQSQVKQHSQQKVVVAVPQKRDEKPLVVLSNKDKPSQVLQQPEQRKRQAMPKGKLALKVVDYDTVGRIIFTGSATPGATARIYVDNRFLRDAFVDKAGAWELRANAEIAPGDHDLRIDELDKVGKVTSRIQLPFTRAQPIDVQAMNKVRNALKTAPAKQTTPAQHAPPPASAAPATPVAPAASIATATPVAPAGPAAPVATAVKKVDKTIRTDPVQKDTIARMEEAVPPPAAPVVTAAPVATPAPEIPKQAEITPAPAPREQIAAMRKPSMRGGTFKELSVPAPQAQVPEPKPQMQAAQQPAAPAQAEPALSNGIVVQPGNNLWNISRVIYGQGAQYTVIYQANTDQIRDPDLIFPGQIFKTPGANPPRVVPPDSRKPITK